MKLEVVRMILPAFFDHSLPRHINSVKCNGEVGTLWPGHRGNFENAGKGRLIDRVATRTRMVKC